MNAHTKTGLVAAAWTLIVSVGCGGFDQPEICAQYLECLAEVNPALVGELAGDLGSDGECWQQDEPTADVCFRACEVGLAQANDAFPNVGDCEP